MTLWIGNVAVLKKFQSMAIIRILKIDNSWLELFNFQNSFNIVGKIDKTFSPLTIFTPLTNELIYKSNIFFLLYC